MAELTIGAVAEAIAARGFEFRFTHPGRFSVSKPADMDRVAERWWLTAQISIVATSFASAWILLPSKDGCRSEMHGRIESIADLDAWLVVLLGKEAPPA